MVHFNKKSITLDYIAIFQMFLILLKLNNKVDWHWFIVFLPYIVATLLAVIGGVLLAILSTFIDEELK